MIQSDMSMLKTLLSMSTSHEKYHFFDKDRWGIKVREI